VQLGRVALRAISVEHFPPFRQVTLAAVFLDQLVDVIAALAVALGAHSSRSTSSLPSMSPKMRYARGMASLQICRANATRIPAPKKQPKSAIHLKVSDRELLAVYQDHVDGDADIRYRARSRCLPREI